MLVRVKDRDGLRKSWLAGAMAAVATLSLSACGGGTENAANQAVTDPARAKDAVQSLLDSIPEQYRKEAERRNRQVVGGLPDVFDRLLKEAEPKKSEGLANFIESLESRLPHQEQQVANARKKVEEAEAAGNANKIEWQKALAAEFSINVITMKSYLERARTATPRIVEAVRRREAGLKGSGPQTSISGAIVDMRKETCFLRENGVAKSTPFSVRGVELGMDGEAAATALCTAQGGKVEQAVGGSNGRTFEDHQVKDEGMALLAMKGFRDGKGTFDHLQKAVETAWFSPGGSKARREQSKSYTRSVSYCLDCVGGPRSDFLDIDFAPDGKIESLRRRQTFMLLVEDGGVRTTRAAPQPLGDISGQLQKQYGKPSFIHSPKGQPILLYGWSYPDRKSPLPTEQWTVSTRPVPSKNNRPGYIAPVVMVNGVDIIDMATDKPSRDKLGARRPTATYCLVSNRLVSREHFLHMGYASFFYGSQALSFTGGPDFSRNRILLTVQPYDRKYDIAGYTPRCGIAVFAVVKLKTQPGVSVGVAEAAGPKSEVESIEIRLLDIDRRQDRAVAEMQQIVGVAQGVQQSLDRKEASGAAKFKL